MDPFAADARQRPRRFLDCAGRGRWSAFRAGGPGRDARTAIGERRGGIAVKRLWIVLLLAALALSGCRFAVVESGEVRVEAPAATPEAS